MVNIRQNLVEESKYSIKCPHEMNPEFIVVHNTANDASAENEIAYMKRNDNKASFHYAVDNVEIVQGIPENRNAWHAGDGGEGQGNRKGIAIEICYSESGGERFDKAEENAAEFIASKLKEKGWGIDKVKKHQDFSNKYCPHRTLDLGWERFLNKVKEHLGIQTQPVENNQNIQEGSDEPVRQYVNGSTPEPIYADTNLTKKIGTLNPRETCDCFGIFENRPMVRYKVDGTNNYKIGFAVWTGGVQ